MHVFVCVSPGLQWGLMHMLSGHVRIQHGKQLCSSNKIIVEETQSFWTQWHGKLSASWDYCVCLKGSINVVTCAYCYATWRSVPEFIACYLIYINRRKKKTCLMDWKVFLQSLITAWDSVRSCAFFSTSNVLSKKKSKELLKVSGWHYFYLTHNQHQVWFNLCNSRSSQTFIPVQGWIIFLPSVLRLLGH